MNILVIGTGVIGTIYGMALSNAGHQVTHYVRPGKGQQFTNGIRVHILDGRGKKPHEYETHYALKVTETLASQPDYDLILVSVRHYQLPALLPLLREHAGQADILFFNGNWQGLDEIDACLPRSRYLWGFPVAGGGYTPDGTLNAALLDEIRLGEIDGQETPRLQRIKAAFESAELKADVQANILHWLWVHFAINSGVIGAAFKAGGARALLNSIPRLREAILAGREALEVCKRRGVKIADFEDARSFSQPAWLGAVAIWAMMKTNLPARRIMETHTAVDELQAIFSDVRTTGEQLQVSMPYFQSLRTYVESPRLVSD